MLNCSKKAKISTISGILNTNNIEDINQKKE